MKRIFDICVAIFFAVIFSTAIDVWVVPYIQANFTSTQSKVETTDVPAVVPNLESFGVETSREPIPTIEPTAKPAPVVEPTMEILLQKSVVVLGNAERTFTGVEVDAGQVVGIRYLSGEWVAGPANQGWRKVGPGGQEMSEKNFNFKLPEEDIMKLIGGISETEFSNDSSEIFSIGDGIVFRSNTTGYIWLGPNDDYYGDNDGGMSVSVVIAKDSAEK